MKNKIYFTKLFNTVVLSSFLFLTTACFESDCQNCISTLNEDILIDEFSEIIESYNESFQKTIATDDNNKVNTNVFVDLSDGITKYALSNQNNKNLLEQFFFAVQNEEELSYFELSNDAVIPYSQSQALSYFLKTGHKDSNGKLKSGAPIDKAFNMIAAQSDLGIVVTDGELYDKSLGQVSMNPWASNALKKWFGKNGSLEIIYTDFNEKNKGKTYEKHMYLMVFMPQNYKGSFVETLKEDLTNQGVSFKSDLYNTNINNLHNRDSYPDAQTPGTLQLSTYGDVSGYFSSKNFEYINLTNVAEFTCYQGAEEGIVYYLRDVGDDNGNAFNFPVIEKLFLDLESISNYSVEEVKINVSNVTNNFTRFKRNFYARKNKPEIAQTSANKDSLNDANHLVFDEDAMVVIDDEYPYNTENRILEDTQPDFSKMLNPAFIFDTAKPDAALKDFIFIDTKAGVNNQENNQKYEVVLKFDKKFNEDTAGFYQDKNNIIKIDVLVEKEDFKLNEVNRQGLTWDKIDDSGIDQTLYISLRNVLNNNKPNSILYTYYVEFGPFNNN